MLSRVAENLYWLGRYLERADNLARLADAHAVASVEQLPGGESPPWKAVIAALGATEAYEAARATRPAPGPQDFVLHSTMYPQSVRSSITQARSLARELREHLSREVFEEINRLYLASTDPGPGALRDFTATVRLRVAAATGLFDHTVLRTEGSAWFRCGQYLERADMTSRIVDSKYFVLLPPAAEVGGALDRSQWMSVLRSASALEAFRKRHREAVSGPAVAGLLLFDAEFPRSLSYCVSELRRNFEAATEGFPAPHVVYPSREIILLQLDLRAADVRGAIRSGLHEFLDEFQSRLIAVTNAFIEHIFRAAPDRDAGDIEPQGARPLPA